MAASRRTNGKALRPWLALLAAAGGLAVAGCAQQILPNLPTALPDLKPSERHVLSDAEQEAAIKGMIDKKNTHESETIEQITKSRTP